MLCIILNTGYYQIWLAIIGDYGYWPYTLGRSMGLYTSECVVDSGTGLWAPAWAVISAKLSNCIRFLTFYPDLEVPFYTLQRSFVSSSLTIPPLQTLRDAVLCLACTFFSGEILLQTRTTKYWHNSFQFLDRTAPCENNWICFIAFLLYGLTVSVARNSVTEIMSLWTEDMQIKSCQLCLK